MRICFGLNLVLSGTRLKIMVRTKFHLTRQRLRRRFSKSQIQPHIHPEKDLSMASYEVCPRKVPINILQMQVSQITLMLVVGENWLKACRRFVRAKIGGQRFNLHLAAHTRASAFFFSSSAFFSAARRLIASIVLSLCGIAIVSTPPSSYTLNPILRPCCPHR